MEYIDEYSFCRPYVNEDEMVLWKGRPQKAFLFTKEDASTVPMSVIICGCSLYATFTAWKESGPVLFRLLSLLFVCFGLYMLIGRFLYGAYLRKRTYYVITNKRIIRMQNNKIDLRYGDDLMPTGVITNPDGSGTIEFGRKYIRRTTAKGTSLEINQNYFALENIPHVAMVQQIIANMEI